METAPAAVFYIGSGGTDLRRVLACASSVSGAGARARGRRPSAAELEAAFGKADLDACMDELLEKGARVRTRARARVHMRITRALVGKVG